MKLSVHFVERFVRFVFDALTTDYSIGINSTNMKTISTQVFDEFTSHNLSGFARVHVDHCIRAKSVFFIIVRLYANPNNNPCNLSYAGDPGVRAKPGVSAKSVTVI
jgi:hypothetical protein